MGEEGGGRLIVWSLQWIQFNFYVQSSPLEPEIMEILDFSAVKSRHFWSLKSVKLGLMRLLLLEMLDFKSDRYKIKLKSKQWIKDAGLFWIPNSKKCLIWTFLWVNKCWISQGFLLVLVPTAATERHVTFENMIRKSDLYLSNPAQGLSQFKLQRKTPLPGTPVNRAASWDLIVLSVLCNA